MRRGLWKYCCNHVSSFELGSEKFGTVFIGEFGKIDFRLPDQPTFTLVLEMRETWVSLMYIAKLDCEVLLLERIWIFGERLEAAIKHDLVFPRDFGLG